MMNLRKLTLAGAATALLLGATACGTQASGKTDAKPAGAQVPAAAPSAAADPYGYGDGAAAPAGAASGPLAVRTDAKLGQVVTDSAGFTLYRFDKDTAKPASTSACSGDCAKTWPPAPAKGVAAGAVPAGALGSLKRADGTEQVTIAGWPVYRFAKDTAPGQTNGQGVGGTWFAVTPEGKKAGAPAAGQPEQPALPALSATDDKTLGKILRDGKGRTLYRFTKDTAWPMKSNCEGACLDKWKPAQPVDADKVEGVDPKLLSTYTRADGTKQLAIDCWPLYWFTGDQNPGDTAGQGVGGTWFTVTPQGKLVK
ncbi:SCO0930 family lipoprotein [Streptomyces sp. NBC_00536]|uniref:SCO0930 family lipoprotein n=1 Tax=Streptomyces sp. NBC_00536 TaxID=2975769 RepID=UPI002E81F55A|nr:SCO0930 family lipoprotein [Streptomyces sp. NBC_00536]WUC82750.1 SCO0930 family lipoprotein [Streptomyces sp. NBC_00536]